MTQDNARAAAEIEIRMLRDLDKRRTKALADCAAFLRGEGDPPSLDDVLMALAIEDSDFVEGMIAEVQEHPDAFTLIDRFESALRQSQGKGAMQ